MRRQTDAPATVAHSRDDLLGNRPALASAQRVPEDLLEISDSLGPKDDSSRRIATGRGQLLEERRQLDVDLELAQAGSRVVEGTTDARPDGVEALRFLRPLALPATQRV